MVGMKMAGGDGVCSLAVHDPIFQYAGEIKAGIYIHTWLKVGGDPVIPGGRDVPHESKPQDVAVLATRHPSISFICGHTGGDWELGIRAVRTCKNVSVEIGAESLRSRDARLKIVTSNTPACALPPTPVPKHNPAGAPSRLPTGGGSFCTAEDRFGLVQQLLAVVTQRAILP